ncbi:hypothetical protein AKJ16_DCAP06065, partial [Drosera capensis]
FLLLLSTRLLLNTHQLRTTSPLRPTLQQHSAAFNSQVVEARKDGVLEHWIDGSRGLGRDGEDWEQAG